MTVPFYHVNRKIISLNNEKENNLKWRTLLPKRQFFFIFIPPLFYTHLHISFTRFCTSRLVGFTYITLLPLCSS